ncbi:MAG: Gfo/Idh/MocA family protein [bacterium]
MAELKEKTLNLAFLGCGFATRLHSKTLTGLNDKVRRYYASRNKEKAIAYCRKYKGHGYFESYNAAINDPNMDVILVATPPVQHLELTLQALRAGKHVIVEKPPFLHSTDFDRVRQVQAETGRRILVAENYFYKPLAIRLRQIISEGLIGDVRFVHVNALKKQKTEDWRDDASVSGGGALFEGGIHWINFIANLGLKIKYARGFRPGAKKGLEKSMLVAIQYEEGPVGAFYYSWEIPSLFKGLRLSKIYGTKGSITFESNGVFIFVRGKKKRFIIPKLADIAGYKNMFQDFIQCLREDKDPQFSLDLAQIDLKLIEDIYQSLNN